MVVEADAIKNRDELFASLSRANLVEMLDIHNELKQHLHEYSTKAAEILLVAAGEICSCLSIPPIPLDAEKSVTLTLSIPSLDRELFALIKAPHNVIRSTSRQLHS